MKKLMELFKTFFIIGAFTIGGGYAMLPLFEEEFVHKKKWLTDENYLNMITISTSAPGPLAVNSAVYTGYHVAGLWGSIFSLFGVIIPPILIILAIIPFYTKFRDLEVIDKIFKGVRPVIVGLIIAATYRMIKNGKIKGYWMLLPILSFATIVIFKIDPVFVIIILGIMGFIKAKIEKR